MVAVAAAGGADGGDSFVREHDKGCRCLVIYGNSLIKLSKMIRVVCVDK